MGHRVEKFLKVLFSPVVWSLAFVWPLGAQIMLSSGVLADTGYAYGIAGVVALSLGLMAQLRGSWIWLK